MAKKIQPWEAEDDMSLTPAPPKKPMPKGIPALKPMPKGVPALKPKKEATVPVGQSEDDMSINKKCGGKVKKYARGGGIEKRGKTKGRMV
jgi:hypothetical protein